MKVHNTQKAVEICSHLSEIPALICYIKDVIVSFSLFLQSIWISGYLQNMTAFGLVKAYGFIPNYIFYSWSEAIIYFKCTFKTSVL